MGARDGAHEEDDRHDHESGGDDRGGQADLPLRVQEAATSRDEHEQEGAEQLREQPAPFELRVVPVLTGTELSASRCPTRRSDSSMESGRSGRRLTGRIDDSRTILSLRHAAVPEQPGSSREVEVSRSVQSARCEPDAARSRPPARARLRLRRTRSSRTRTRCQNRCRPLPPAPRSMRPVCPRHPSGGSPVKVSTASSPSSSS